MILADKSMCDNKDCPIKLQCLRYTAKPNEWQSYTTFQYKKGKCDFYIQNLQSSIMEDLAEKIFKNNPLMNPKSNATKKK